MVNVDRKRKIIEYSCSFCEACMVVVSVLGRLHSASFSPNSTQRSPIFKRVPRVKTSGEYCRVVLSIISFVVDVDSNDVVL